jgi:cytochrome P450 family 20 subfamily A
MLSDLLAIFIGGFHTSATLLTWAIYLLALHQDVQDRARKEVVDIIGEKGEVTPETVEQLVYLQQVIDETLRWATIAPYACRSQDVETTLGGHTIPAGTNVVHALGVALHDPEVFPDPDKFDPERFSSENKSRLPPYAFEPFGFAGKRKCLGYRFSLAEALILLAHILRSNLRLELAPDQVVTPKYTIVSIPSDEVWITVKPQISVPHES